METIQSILDDATRDICSALELEKAVCGHGNPGKYRTGRGWDYGVIEQDLMSAVKARITRINSLAMKGEPRVRMPQNLDAGQIAAVLRSTMDLEAVVDGSGRHRLAVRLPDGGLTYDLKEFYCAAMKLDRRLTRRSLARVAERAVLDIEYG